MEPHHSPRLSLIAALASKDRAIGKDNRLLWHIPADLRHFKEITAGHPVIMGERTFHSIGRPRPGRLNIVLSDNPAFAVPGVSVASSLDEALSKARQADQEEVFVIGGASVFAQTIEAADRLYLTLVEGEYAADTFFPEYGAFTTVLREEVKEEGGHRFRFVTLEKG
jgi:dihydrofolate reductase